MTMSITNVNHMSALTMLPEDIRKEFEVKPDGRVVCKSWRALARLCGTSSSAFLDTRDGRLRSRLLTKDSVANSLKPLMGRDLSQLEEIDEVVMSCLIKYFAWEAPDAKPQAKEVDLALSAMGIRAFFQQQLGWHPQQRPALEMSYADALEQLLLAERKKERVRTSYPGLDATYEASSEDIPVVAELGYKFTLKDWLAYKGYDLDRAERISLGQFMASSIERDTFTPLQRIRTGNIVYNPKHLPLLDECYEGWIRRGSLRQYQQHAQDAELVAQNN